MRQSVFCALALMACMAMAYGAANYLCKHCGEKFSSASSGRVGYCTASSSHKHIVISGGGPLFCQFCGEKFSSATSVRVGYCTQNPSHKHALAGGSEKKLRGVLYLPFLRRKVLLAIQRPRGLLYLLRQS